MKTRRESALLVILRKRFPTTYSYFCTDVKRSFCCSNFADDSADATRRFSVFINDFGLVIRFAKPFRSI